MFDVKRCTLDVERKKILPLFQTYVMKECFAYSLVGKVGLMGDFADLQVAETLLHDL